MLLLCPCSILALFCLVYRLLSYRAAFMIPTKLNWIEWFIDWLIDHLVSQLADCSNDATSPTVVDCRPSRCWNDDVISQQWRHVSYSIFLYVLFNQFRSLALPAMGHWGTSPSTSNCLIFLVTSEPHKLWHWTLCGWIPGQNILAYSFVTVYCMLFIIFSCVTLRLSFLSFVPLPAPNAARHWFR